MTTGVGPDGQDMPPPPLLTPNDLAAPNAGPTTSARDIDLPRHPAVPKSEQDVAPETAPTLQARVADGVRLDTLQVYNWGTYHSKVYTLGLQGGNGLLTGDVGSGKSTLVDAMTALLAPANRIVFNAAAGADRDERSLTSYALGQYGKIEDESTSSSRAQYLRTRAGTLSAIVATFASLTGLISGGLVLTFNDRTSAPQRMYLVADRSVDIETGLLGHADIKGVKASLRASGIELFDSFERYQGALCRKLGLSPAGLALFATTVSMKQVGNLTDFVRSHMLDAPDIGRVIDTMLSHYGDLTRAHDLVVDVRKQLEVLDEVERYSRRYDDSGARISATEHAARAVPAHVDRLRATLLQSAISEAEGNLPALASQIDRIGQDIALDREREVALNVALNEADGGKVETARLGLVEARKQVEQVATSHAKVLEWAAAAEVRPPAGPEEFPAFRGALDRARQRTTEEQAAQDDAFFAARTVVNEIAGQLKATEDELRDAGTRDSNIPTDAVRLRDLMCTELGLPAGVLPYAGELLSVAADHKADWEPAAERLLRPLALSLLVPDQHYRAVAAWVDSHHLRSRLVYQAVRGRLEPVIARGDSMAAKIEIKTGTVVSDWLAAEVARRFRHVCVDDATALATHETAVTRAGQIKGGSRHEKDDRHKLDDRSRYVLGWDNRARRAALAQQVEQLREQVTDAVAEWDIVKKAGVALKDRTDAVTLLWQTCTDPASVDLAGAHERVKQSKQHYDTLVNDPTIAKVMAELTLVLARLREADDRRTELTRRSGQVTGRMEECRRQLGKIDVVDVELESTPAELFAAALAEAGDEPEQVEDCGHWQNAILAGLERVRALATQNRARAGQYLVAEQQKFAAGWPQLCEEIDTRSTEVRNELLELQRRLKTDDLPRFEADFRTHLEKQAINEIAAFHRGLVNESKKIAGRLETINAALARTNFGADTYIVLEAKPTTSPQILDFRADLRSITEGAVDDDEESLYSEARFLRVRDLLDRFVGRPDSVVADRGWATRVTDVRQWFTFAASERTREDDTQVEYYTDSDGKSGGQKEKLAYTILAASLAYQYGLADGRADAFRFVMIDEAFTKGSDEAGRFGMDLFTRLGLQMLVITPLQKIWTIEPYVSAVGFAHAVGRRSEMITMTVEEYRARRAAHAYGPPALPAAVDEGGDIAASPSSDARPDRDRAVDVVLTPRVQQPFSDAGLPQPPA
ncbi:ATP-binding protein [Modestobacter marinus]|uniref:ATP-binding protein n=1 Tax=Modestobacter marinus TaxID=477641 RepID=A0A846LS00_9ACTN|nr:SbcC/MukB-like Walker B domain-containing protein [Modestobacter marinus]NIH69214.1 uncharacterized protein YPO0396 [Modestobacter marinus]GGL76590.1 ATP-binding protein [Modestobacter marinus]